MFAAIPDASAPPGRPARLPGFDVVRGVALIGVVVMNYHGYLNGGSGTDPSWAERLFDPFRGPLSTRFAATFVMIAGVGVVLLTNRARLGGEPQEIARERWRLIRRGVFLLTLGYVVDWIWQGTILFYYGAMFILAAGLFTLRIRWLVGIGWASVLAAWTIQLWALQRFLDGSSADALLAEGRWSFDPASMRSPWRLVTDIWVNGTHPLLPWLGFFCAGMVIGRLIPHLDVWRRGLMLAGGVLLGAGYGIATVIDRAITEPDRPFLVHLSALGQTDPYSRQPLYFVTTFGSSLIAVVGIAWLGDRYASSPVIDVLRRAGQMTLTLYLAHIVVFDLLVTDLGMVQPTGLDTALVFAVCFWVVAIAAGSFWNRVVGRGPAEWVYRKFSE